VAYLVSKGIVAARLSSKGYGASQPVATNDSEEGKARNRRTELVVTGI
jgi:outer membrane protein OmpA-like peptidoglycan-associated protein